MSEKSRKRLGGELRESAGRIWLAGLGALATAEEEGGKLFRNLVERGESFDGPDPVGAATRKARDARQQAGKAMGKVEEAFDQRVTDALHRVGVPTRREIEALTERIEKLQGLLEAQAADAATSGPRPRKAAAKKSVRKKTAKASSKATARSASKAGKSARKTTPKTAKKTAKKAASKAKTTRKKKA
ncbi:hypothetical protein ABI59_15850 [Acidobacteria bacterium Mor1]|nr:hypothetical protein ABI59_15850 [Acidobacteria bacterium Mor1]